MKYLLIGRKGGPLLRGSYEPGRRFCEWFSDDFEFGDGKYITKFSQLEGYDKIIFRAHGEKQYKIPVNAVSLRNINHLIYTRYDHTPRLYNSCTNGFYYYKNYPEIKHFLPMISPFHVEQKEFERPCIGYYERNCSTMDSYIRFRDMLVELKVDVDLYFMGNPPKQKFGEYPHVKSVNHTYDNVKFFESITHYIIPDSIMHDDTFTNSMYEAVQANKQIISPHLDRPQKHGIDDIRDCIKYHTEFNPDVYHDNGNTVLKAEHFKGFYRKLIDNGFEYSFDRNKYKTFREWIEREVL